MQDRFLRCPIYRKSQLDIGWTDKHSERLNEIAAEDHFYIAAAHDTKNTEVLVLTGGQENL